MPSPAVSPAAGLHGSEPQGLPPGVAGDGDPAIRAVVRAALAAPVPMWVGWGADLTGFGNAAFEALLARQVRPGSPASEVWRDLGEGLLTQIGAASAGEGRIATVHLGPRRGRAILSAGPVLDEAGRPCGVLCTLVPQDLGNGPVQNATDAPRREMLSRKAWLADLGDVLGALDDSDAIAEAAAARLGPHLGVLRCGFARADATGEVLTVTRDWTAGVASAVGAHRLDAFGPWIATSLRRGEAAAVADANGDPRIGPRERAAHAELGVRAHVAAPVLRARTLAAVLFVHSASPRVWSEAEVELIRDVAERTCAAMEASRALRALRSNEALTRDILEISDDCIKLLDLDGRLRFMSTGGQRVMQVDDFSLLEGRYWPDIWPDDAKPQVEAALAHAREGRLGRFREEARTVRGTPRFWDVVVSPIVGDDGRPARLLAISRDITAQRQAEESLRESEGRFRAMADSAPVMIWTSDADGRCTYVNRIWQEFTGSHLSQAMDRNVLMAIHPDDRPRTEAIVTAARAARRPFQTEYRLARADGSYAWVIDTASPRLAPDGAYLGDVGSVLDISERRRAEEKQALLVNELNHRVKNTLAVVQSLAIQSFRLGQVDPTVRNAFEARLLSLARAHDVLTQESWEGAQLCDIARRAVQPFAGGPDRIALEGRGVWLPPQMALAVAMALHELATNAAKYGALSISGGQVDLSWTVADLPQGRRLRLSWVERNGPPVPPPARRGFGSRLIQQGLAAELGGEVVIDYLSTGVMCRVDAPLPTEDAG
ncbi:PAS domain S-box protein [Rubellimicrobium rubrum]|uniref:histidine kinase n=1 Tax=Rubellimicrobium rubrum TaxID=2585369 RepID=A0A5C4MS03_9RHOB|nr:PAS domain S-box protein [Rubellimicrobium rubrum]TNC48319.1 PAS domain S-box protein [Rubellimicrobium rubrum]